MSKEFPELQKLLQLRGQAGPADEYFEEFLQEFHRRQRQDLMKRSARSLFLERLTVWFREMGSARWLYVGGAAYAAVMVLFFAWPKETPGNESLSPASQQLPLPGADRDVLQFDSGKPKEIEPASVREF